MSMQPAVWPEPDPGVAAAVRGMYGSRKSEPPLAVAIRDRLGEWLHDEDFAAVFGAWGRPGWPPSRLALVTVLQRAENLTDRMAAHPGWAVGVLDVGWARRYGTPVTSWRPPVSEKKRDELAVAYG